MMRGEEGKTTGEVRKGMRDKRERRRIVLGMRRRTQQSQQSEINYDRR